MARTIEINGVTFEVIINRKYPINEEYYNAIRDKEYIDIHSVYSKCSHVKELIFYNWRNYFSTLETATFKGISTYNSNFFTLEGTLEHNGEKYIYYITRSHNKLYKVTTTEQ